MELLILCKIRLIASSVSKRQARDYLIFVLNIRKCRHCQITAWLAEHNIHRVENAEREIGKGTDRRAAKGYCCVNL
ncbi:MAG: hypothetical protein WKF37_08960 [Bryobacteraceae bacterium]